MSAIVLITSWGTAWRGRWQLMHVAIDATRPVICSEIVQGNDVRPVLTSCPYFPDCKWTLCCFLVLSVEGTSCSALLDFGCSCFILNANVCWSWLKKAWITTLTGATQTCCRSITIRIHMATCNAATIDVLVIWRETSGFKPVAWRCSTTFVSYSMEAWSLK